MRISLRVAVMFAFVVALAARSEAAPIVYHGQLQPGVPVLGINTQGTSNQSNPVGADYWQFYAVAGANVSIDGDRQAGHYDMSFWVLFGTFADTNDLGATFDSGDSSFTLFADDDTGPAIGGPFGDPLANFIAPSTGFYTVAVTNFLSGAAPPNPYQLTAAGVTAAVPEPASMFLLGSGITSLIAARRRRKQRAQ
jgi:hypothetical protein